MAAEISDAHFRAGDGEPLVLIHGFTATWRCRQPVPAELAGRFEVIAPTLHGHDGGPPPPGLRAQPAPRTRRRADRGLRELPQHANVPASVSVTGGVAAREVAFL